MNIKTVLEKQINVLETLNDTLIERNPEDCSYAIKENSMAILQITSTLDWINRQGYIIGTGNKEDTE